VFFFSRGIGASNIVCNYLSNYQFSSSVVLSLFIIIILLLLCYIQGKDITQMEQVVGYIIKHLATYVVRFQRAKKALSDIS